MGILNKKKVFKKTMPIESESIEEEEEFFDTAPIKDKDIDSIEELEKEIEKIKAEKENLIKAKQQKQVPKEIILVVKELPTAPYRRATDSNGTIINYVTVEEALTKILNEED